MAFPKPEDLEQPVVVYLTAWCPYCVAARRLLDSKGISYQAVDVAGDAEARAWLANASGQHTVPQVFIHRASIGGYTELAALDRRGELDRALIAS